MRDSQTTSITIGTAFQQASDSQVHSIRLQTSLAVLRMQTLSHFFQQRLKTA
jgi:hypothetical protein